MPTHVHMVFGGEMTLGWYTPGPARTVGTFLRADPVTHRKSDHGQYVSFSKLHPSLRTAVNEGGEVP